MERVLFLAALLAPLVSGGLLCLLRDREGPRVPLAALAATVLTSALVWYLIARAGEGTHVLLAFTESLVLCLGFDGLGRFFAGILASLWPLTVLYAMSYLRGKTRPGSFYGFFTLSYAASLGVAMAGNLFTLYVFYELLTLATAPLVLYPMTRQALRAARTYLIFSLGGAAFGFAAMVWLFTHGAGGTFTLGGLLSAAADGETARLFFLLGFLASASRPPSSPCTSGFPAQPWSPRPLRPCCTLWPWSRRAPSPSSA